MIKLNLGAGNKPLPHSAGWINIDLCPPSSYDRSKYIYNKDDVQRLETIQSESVNEILASHVIEHIHPSQVQGTLRLWYDKLEDGGLIALEQPDIIKCCMNVLQMCTSDDPRLYLNNGLWGIYGNSTHPGDMMGHQWGYTPESLANLLENAGFTDIQEEDPTVKPWGIGVRDFRLVARR